LTLLVDVGNSRIKWARLTDGGYRAGSSVSWRDQDLGDVLESNWRDLPRPGSVLACNVAGPQARTTIEHWIARHWQCPVELAAVQKAAFGVTNGYDEVAQMGVDRWVAMLAAWQHCHSAVCVVDCGTAITVDVLSGEGHHLGGLIAPGLSLMQEILATGTAQLPKIPSEVGVELGTNTHSCIAAGCMAAATGVVNFVKVYVEELGLKPVRWLLTGGDAEALATCDPKDMEHVPDLVLRGLALLVDTQR